MKFFSLSGIKRILGFNTEGQFGGAFETNKLFSYISELINRKDLVKKEFSLYENVKRSYTKWSKYEYIPIYFDLERFISANGKPVVKHGFTKSDLRKNISSNVNINKLSDEFRLVFLPDDEQSLLLFEIGLHHFINYISDSVGFVRIREIISHIAKDTVLENLIIDEKNKLDFIEVRKKAHKMKIEDVAIQFRLLYKTFYEEILKSFGEKNALEVFTNNYDFIKNTYKSGDIISRFFKIIPEGILDDERLRFLTRDELERKLTEINQLNITITQEKNKLQTTLKSIGDCVFVIDYSGKITLVNPVAETISGYKSDELLGKHYKSVLKLLHEEDKVKNTSFIEKALVEGNVTHIIDKTIFVSKNKNTTPIEGNASPIINEKGSVSGLIIIIHDITKKRELEKTKINFVSVASHQLRTPLSEIRWASDELLGEDKNSLTEDQKNLIENIHKSAKTLIDITKILLTSARLEEGSFDAHPSEFDVVEHTKKILTELKAMTDKKNIHVSIESTDLPNAKLDNDMFKYALTNLISNAINYTVEGGNITIKFKLDDDNILCSVSDTGIGIPEKNKDRIFEKFYRAKNAITMMPDGTGMGLNFAKTLVTTWKGKIWFESKEGEGSTFFFTIPVSN